MPNTTRTLTEQPWFDEIYEQRLRTSLRVRQHLYSTRSAYQQIDVFDTYMYGRVLALDGVLMTSEAEEYFYHELLTHPTMTILARIERVLVIGGGDGGTVREVLRYPEVQEVVLVEIDGEVVEACRRFLPSIGTAWDDPRLKVQIEDGIEFVKRTHDKKFDAIFLDSTDPVGPGEGLFDRDFYNNCAALLHPHGILTVQSESPFLMPNAFRSILSNLGSSFQYIRPYFGPAPLYSAGLWSWTHASQQPQSEIPQPARLAHLERCKYYNGGIHAAIYAQPSFISRLLNSQLAPESAAASARLARGGPAG